MTVGKSHSIAVIGGDGIGPEVIGAGVQVLDAAAKKNNFKIDWTPYDFSSDRYKKEGVYIPKDGLTQLKKHEAIFFGAVGAPGMGIHFAIFICLAYE